MSAVVMAKKKETGKKSGVTLKAYPAERELINKAAGARGESVAELLKSTEVRTFFTHLLVAAAQKEEKNLQADDKL